MSDSVTIADVPLETEPTTTSRLIAELFGTFMLVFALVGAALFSAGIPEVGIGWFGVAFTLGITVMAAAYAVGHISGGHFNPAVTLGAAAAGRFAWKDVPVYIAAQVVGGLLGALVIFILAANGPEGALASLQAGGFASNGFGEASPTGFGLGAVIIAEIVGTAIFLFVILGVTDRRAPSGFAPIAIGFTLTLLLLVLIPISNASLNPARSLATAVFGGEVPLTQLWVFIVAPIVGALIAGFLYKPLFEAVRPLKK